MAVRYKAWVCSRLIFGIVEGMKIHFLVCCALCELRPLLRADHSLIGVLPAVCDRGTSERVCLDPTWPVAPHEEY